MAQLSRAYKREGGALPGGVNQCARRLVDPIFFCMTFTQEYLELILTAG